MRPLAIMDGMPRAASARRKLGHSSVSMPMKKRGRTASSARRTGPGRSTGKYRWPALPSSLSATHGAPVAVARHEDGLAEAHHAARERLGDPEFVPRACPPFGRRSESRRYHVGAGQPCQPYHSRLEDFAWSSRAVGHDDDAVALSKGAGQRPESLRASATRRTANGDEAEATDEVGHHRAVLGAAHQSPEPPPAEEVRQEEEPCVPYDVDDWRARGQEGLDALLFTPEVKGGGQQPDRPGACHRRQPPAEPAGLHCAPTILAAPATFSTARAARSPTPGFPSRAPSSLNAARWAGAAMGSTRRCSASLARRAPVTSSCRISGTALRPAMMLGRLIQGERLSTRAINSVSLDTR